MAPVVMPRFFAPGLGEGGAVVPLPDEEARHLARVLRLRPGAAVSVFDGRGREMTARVETAGRAGVTVRLLAPVTSAPEPRVAVTLASAFLKGDAMDAVVRDATMLGVASIAPVVAARSQVTPAAARRGHREARWHRIAIAAAKQCGRAVVPALAPPDTVEAFVANEAAELRLILVEPRAEAGAGVTLEALRARAVPAGAAVLVGPEGGWTGAELESARARGWTPLRLGGRTLRAEAAPLVALAALMAGWGEL